MKRTKATIISNKKAARGRFKMRLASLAMAKAALPGQFVMIKCTKGLLPFLRRPLAFHAIGRGTFDVLYEVVGKGTEALSKKKRGEKLDVIGPLGNGFRVCGNRKAIIVAGGIGVAPMPALAKALIKDGKSVTAVLGAKTKSHLVCDKELRALGAKVKISTDDGSKGHKGFATDLLRGFLKDAKAARQTTIYACGPKAMLRETAKIARAAKTACNVSLEEKMACGAGVCMGCAVKTKSGYKMACKEGPVFKADEIIW